VPGVINTVVLGTACYVFSTLVREKSEEDFGLLGTLLS